MIWQQVASAHHRRRRPAHGAKAGPRSTVLEAEEAIVVEAPGSAGHLCLIAPTWRGPLPTMMNGKRPAFRWLARAVDVPLLGQAFYRLNVSQPVIRKMVSGHVYDDPTWLTDTRLAEKRAVTSAPG